MEQKKEIITGDMVVNVVVKKYPATLKVFNQFKVDSCCGGAQTIKKSAAEDKIDLEALLVALNKVVS